MKRIAFLLMMVALASFGYATSLDMPEEIPSSINWTLVVNLNSTDTFETVKVYLDDVKVVTMHTVADGSGDVSQTDETRVLKAFAIDTDTGSKEGLQLYVSFFGLSDDLHTVKVEIIDDGSVVDEETKEIVAFQALSQRVKEEIEAKLNEMKVTSESLEQKVSGFESTTSANASEIASLKTLVEQLNSSISSLQGSLQELDSETSQELEALQGNVSELDAELLQAGEDLNALANRGAVVTATGLASFGGFDPLLGLLAILAVVAVLWFGHFLQTKGFGGFRKTIYKEKPKFAFGKEDKQIMGTVLEESPKAEAKPEPKPGPAPEPQASGKWAFGKEPAEKKESKGFQLGDLLKK